MKGKSKVKLKTSTEKPKTGNKVLNEILDKIQKATENEEKSVLVFTTNTKHYKTKGEFGFSASDLKPKVLEAYRQIFCLYNLVTTCTNPNDMVVEWVVKLK